MFQFLLWYFGLVQFQHENNEKEHSSFNILLTVHLNIFIY